MNMHLGVVIVKDLFSTLKKGIKGRINKNFVFFCLEI